MTKYLLTALLLLTIPVLADEREVCTPKNGCDLGCDVKDCRYRKWFVDFNVGYFRPFSKSLRTVIGEGGVDYQLALTYNWNCYLGTFISGDYFYKSGHSTGSGSKTDLWIAPLTIGLRASANLWKSDNSALKAYALFGPRWYFVGAKNDVSYLKHHNFAQNIGCVGGVGLSYLYRQLTINAFFNSSFGNVKTHSGNHNVKAPTTQVGGMTFGAGIGWNY